MKTKLPIKEELEEKKANKSLDDLIRRMKTRHAFISVVIINEKPSFKQQSIF